MNFAPLPRRQPGALSSILSNFSDGVASIEAQREPHAQFWDEWNAEAVAADGPLWVVLGDSSSQGIGARDPLESWVPLLLDRLRAKTGDPWRVINLAITGGQFGDIAASQLPRIGQLRDDGQEPQIVSLLAGANNLMAPNSWVQSFEHLDQILYALPAGRSVVARVGVANPLNSLMARKFNKRIEAAAQERDFKLFWPWAWPSRDGMAGDKWHPSPKGYGYMLELIWPCFAEIVDAQD